MSEENKHLLRELKGSVLWLTINRPEKRNALSLEVMQGIGAGLREATENGDIRAVVLTGAGDKAFCAGADLKKSDEGGEKGPFGFDPANPQSPLIDLFGEFVACPKPVVARVNGHVLAGGMGLFCACDMAIGVEGGLVGTPEVKIGVFPMMILSYLMRVIPQRRLYEMTLTGEPWKAEEVPELFNYVVPPEELDAKLDWFMARLLDKSPTAQRLGKKAMGFMHDMTLEQRFAYSQSVLPLMGLTQDAAEGVAAFNEKRPPKFPGK